MLRQFEKLGDAVAQSWEKAGRDEDALSEIARSALIASNVLNTVSPHEIITWLMHSDQVPPQDAEDFGQPPVNVYVGEGFYIQALFWIDGTTAIHEHSFTGAFGVLHGSSVHSTYSFKTEKVAARRLVIGQTELVSAELLHRGDVRAILPGDKLIHSLFHLDRPSVSLVIRTSPKIHLTRPQYAYLKPFLAFDDTRLPKLQMIQLRMLESLFAADLDAFWRIAGDVVANCDPFVLSQVLAIAFRKAEDSANWNALLGRIAAGNKELVEYIVPCLKEGSRINRLLSLRANVHDPIHRFFLALLLNVPRREQIYKLVAQKFPSSDPKALVLQWLGEIFGEERSGIRISPPALVLIDRILDDPDFERSKAALTKHFEIYPEIDEGTLRNSWLHIQNVDVLKPLFSTSTVM
ncbi:MAG TPA: hypothetical protein VF532_22200 [Candidatus Angelobacter sp.]